MKKKKDTEYLGYSAGFTSKEVHNKNVNDISVYSDIYSLGAVLYYAITGSMLTLDKESYEIDASLLNSSVKQFLKKLLANNLIFMLLLKNWMIVRILILKMQILLLIILIKSMNLI